VSPGTIRSGGQQTWGDEAVIAPLVGGSSCAQRFGRSQQVRRGAVTGPVGHEDEFLGQHRLREGSAQKEVRLLQHLWPHSSSLRPQRLQIDLSGFWQRQFGGQQLSPQRARPPGHFPAQVSTRRPPTLVRTHSAPLGQQTPLHTC
jgi:hypothetical protein